MMGSKMASASRVVQVVKPHTPLIRFPDRNDNPKPNVSEVLRSQITGLLSHSSSISQGSKGSKSPDLLMHQGPSDTAEIIKTLRQRYRRKLVSQEEIEFGQELGINIIVNNSPNFIDEGKTFRHQAAGPRSLSWSWTRFGI
ncbi:28S ribosomal protein S36, mitochondrial-like [Eumetopias jubatus]|uniref:28S ribosomal protein S36, mitochondrial-like n=1 Tax=Eumetopias jubatus TaxID=34886 RepID=UPI000F7FADA7|nr:28S ribosomal protein S36, mitochondrial-like [Eumetopias jubatus]